MVIKVAKLNAFTIGSKIKRIWKRSIDRGKVFGALLTDLSKAFDCLNHVFDSKIKRIWF